MDIETIDDETLIRLTVPDTGSLLPVLRSLKVFVPARQEFIEQNEDYQLRLITFLYSVKVNPRKKRQRPAKVGPGRQQNTEIAENDPERNDAELRTQFSHIMMEILKLKLTRKTYVKLLLHIHDRIIPNMAKPLLLSDFLVSSFSQGGLISILALNGLFKLIQEHHLDFPQFYERFYALLTPEVLNAKYRARFFYLADQFMGSSHVPAYTIAAVAKRLSRLSLTAPADSIPLILTFVMNLIIRHPSLTCLIHKTVEEEDVRTDPYILEEPDMQKCCALESCLWELKTMKAHYNKNIVRLACHLDQKLPQVEFDITDHLETDTQELVESVLQETTDVLNRLTGKVKPSALFPSHSHGFSSLWEL